MRRAVQTGRPAASGIVELVQESKARGKQAGFLIYVPVYAESARPAMVASANHARPIEAFVYAPFRGDDLLTAALGKQTDTIGGIELRARAGDRKRVGEGKRVSVHVNLGVRRILTKK